MRVPKADGRDQKHEARSAGCVTGLRASDYADDRRSLEACRVEFIHLRIVAVARSRNGPTATSEQEAGRGHSGQRKQSDSELADTHLRGKGHKGHTTTKIIECAMGASVLFLSQIR